MPKKEEKKPTRRILKVKLAREGKVVPNPINGQRMEFGKEYDVPDAPFWRRRIMGHDLELVSGPDMPVGTPKIHGEDKDKKSEEKKSEADKKPASKPAASNKDKDK